MSRTNASGWMALAAVAAVFAAAILVREAPGVHPASVTPVLAARTLPLLAAPLAITPDPLSGPIPTPEGAKAWPARRTAAPRLLARARTELPPLDVHSALPSGATPVRPTAPLNAPRDSVVAALGEPGATDAPLAARRVEMLDPTAGTSARAADPGNSHEGGEAGAVKRAFDTAGRSIAGGMKSAGAAIRGVF